MYYYKDYNQAIMLEYIRNNLFIRNNWSIDHTVIELSRQRVLKIYTQCYFDLFVFSQWNGIYIIENMAGRS
jgi:hypothetical protein